MEDQQQESFELDAIKAEAAEALKLYYSFDTDRKLQELKDQLGIDPLSVPKPDRRVFRIWQRIAVAASIVVTIGMGLWFYKMKYHVKVSGPLLAAVKDFLPGKNAAVLTLANGKTISLSNSKTGIVIDASQLSYNDGTTLFNTGVSGKQSGNELTVTTPLGGTYQVSLPDGSKVWLNAGSQLRFPAKFTGKDRKVELEGEGYFEVSKNKAMPFKVKSNDQEIEVLGTHFNINSYINEGSTKTTLLEGAVKVTTLNTTGGTMVVLKPGQQSVLVKDELKVRQADVETVVSWKNGYFRFDDEELESIMRKVSRWYNVEVVYQNERLKKEPFAGIITRETKVSELLKMLALAGEVKFEIKNNTIIVMNKE